MLHYFKLYQEFLAHAVFVEVHTKLKHCKLLIEYRIKVLNLIRLLFPRIL
jgi:hypothetical protein